MNDAGTNVQETSQSTEQVQNQNDMSAALAQQMQVSLAGFTGNDKIENPNNQTTQQPTTETVAQVENQTQQTAQETTQAEETQQASDPFQLFKDKFGYETPEDAALKIQELIDYKEKSPSQELKFENPESKKVFEALQAGDFDEVYKGLSNQVKLNYLTEGEVTKEKAEEIIKFKMKAGNDHLSDDDINFQYNEDFSIPKEPVQRTTEDDDEFEERKEDWRNKVQNIERKKIVAAKMAIPSLQEAKSKISYPEIEQKADPKYLEWQKIIEEQDKLDAQIKEIYKAVTPDEAETKLSFNDEDNKIKFDFQFKPDSNKFTKTVELATNVDNLLKNFVKSDGTFDKTGYIRAMDIALNWESYLMEAMKQSKNATLKSTLPDNNGTQRQFPQHQEMSELDKQMQMSLQLNGRRTA